MGRFWQTDHHGRLLNDCRRDAVPASAWAAVADIRQAYTQHIAHDLHSLYLTGETARGMSAAEGATISVFGVLEYHTDPELVMQDWMAQTAQRICAAHPAIKEVALDLMPQGYIFRDPEEFSPGAFTIATQSLCVWGSDLAPELPDYFLTHRPTRLAIANDDIVNLRLDMEEARAEIDEDPAAAHVQRWCRRACQHLVWTGFSLVMEAVRAYTRDVHLAAAHFCHYYPQQAQPMQQAADWALRPTHDAGALLAFLDDFGGWMLARCEDWLGLHNPTHDLFFVLDAEVEAETEGEDARGEDVHHGTA